GCRWRRLLCKHGEDNRQERAEPKEISFHWEADGSERRYRCKMLWRASICRRSPKGSVDFTSLGDRSRRLIRIVQRSLNTSLFTREQQARQSRVSGSLIGKGNSTKGDI